MISLAAAAASAPPLITPCREAPLAYAIADDRAKLCRCGARDLSMSAAAMTLLRDSMPRARRAPLDGIRLRYYFAALPRRFV